MQAGRVVFCGLDEGGVGRPASEAIVEELDRLRAKRAFLMVSGTLNRETDTIANISRAIGSRCVAIFDAMPPHTPRAAVIAASEQARATKADIIVTVGGGSITDGAKAVQFCLANDVRSPDDIDRIRSGRGPSPPLVAPTVRQISVPTTIAGGEFSAIAGVTNEKTKVKEALRHPLLMPRATILDPWLGAHTPEWLWLSTGIRAVDHCAEGICSREAHPYGDAQALKGLAILARALPRVKADGGDLDARLDCQIGTWLSTGPLASGVPMGASHAIGHILGGTCDVPHGYTSCVMSPYVLAWNAEHDASRQARTLAVLGGEHASASAALDAFIAGLGMPRRLSEVGVDESRFQQVAEYTLLDIWGRTNPRPVTSAADILEILRRAA